MSAPRPDPTRDSTGAAVPFADEVLALAEKHAGKAARGLPYSTGGSRPTAVDTAVIKASMYEFMLQVLALMEQDSEEPEGPRMVTVPCGY